MCTKWQNQWSRIGLTETGLINKTQATPIKYPNWEFCAVSQPYASDPTVVDSSIAADTTTTLTAHLYNKGYTSLNYSYIGIGY